MVQELIESVQDSDLRYWRKFVLNLNLRMAEWCLERDRPLGALLQLKVFQRKVERIVDPTNPDLATQWIAEAQAIIDAIVANCTGDTPLERLLELVRASDLPPNLKSFLIARLEAAIAAEQAGDSAGAAEQLESALADSGLGSASDDLQVVLADEISAVSESLAAPVVIRLQAIVGDRPGCIRVTFQGVSGQNYTLEASTNLIDWEAICVVRPDEEGDCCYEDVTAGQRACRFYRVVRQ
jgi:hypothetical protein